MKLRQLLHEVENGTFLRPSERRHRPIKHGPPMHMTLRELVSAYIAAARKRRGKNTASNYKCRLLPLLEFAERPENRKRWPYVGDIDGECDFALDLKRFLYQRMVTRNGRSLSEPKRMSARQIHNVLGTVAAMLADAKRPEVNLLPLHFVNPFTRDLIGEKPMRDPLEKPKLSMDVRIAMVKLMDWWQLATLSWSFVLPQRPDEITGILIGDVNIQSREIIFGNRWGGDDYNKARAAFRICYPQQFDVLAKWLMGNRTAGPLLLRRTICEGRRQSRYRVKTPEEISSLFDKKIAKAPTDQVQNEQDRKRLFRSLLLELGGATGDDLGKEFQDLLHATGVQVSARFYETRSATITDLRHAQVSEILRRYICGRVLGRDSHVHYEGQDLHGDMDRYFASIAPLLDAIATRAAELKLQAQLPDRGKRNCDG
jgi:hypothetical protein